MTVIVGKSRYTCTDEVAAETLRRHLVCDEELDDVTRDGPVVVVPGMTPAGCIEIAEIGVEHGWMTDAAGAQAVREVEAVEKFTLPL